MTDAEATLWRHLRDRRTLGWKFRRQHPVGPFIVAVGLLPIGEDRPIGPGDVNVFDGAIDKIEFLGSYCLVRVNAEAMGSEPITVYLSLNYLAEQGLDVGSRLPLKVLPERMRFF